MAKLVRSFSTLLLLTLGNTLWASHALNGLYPTGGAAVLLLLLGLLLLAHVILLLLNVAFKKRGFHIYNTIWCILLTAVALLMTARLGPKFSVYMLYYIPFGWTLWALGRPKKKNTLQ